MRRYVATAAGVLPASRARAVPVDAEAAAARERFRRNYEAAGLHKPPTDGRTVGIGGEWYRRDELESLQRALRRQRDSNLGCARSQVGRFRRLFRDIDGVKFLDNGRVWLRDQAARRRLEGARGLVNLDDTQGKYRPKDPGRFGPRD